MQFLLNLDIPEDDGLAFSGAEQKDPESLRARSGVWLRLETERDVERGEGSYSLGGR